MIYVTFPRFFYIFAGFVIFVVLGLVGLGPSLQGGSFLQPGSSWDPNLNVSGQVWGNFGALLGPVQSE